MMEAETATDTFEIHSILILRAKTTLHSVGAKVLNLVFHLVKYAMPSLGFVVLYCTISCRIWTELNFGGGISHVTNVVHLCHLANASHSCLRKPNLKYFSL
jgi:hypothetical protein